MISASLACCSTQTLGSSAMWSSGETSAHCSSAGKTAAEEPHKKRATQTNRLSSQSFILLPFLLILTLPSLTLRQPASDEAAHLQATKAGLSLSGLLVALLTLPFDRLRLESASLVGALEAKEINSKLDLQEEETHAMLLAPDDHRGSIYTAAAGSQAPAGYAGPRGAQHAYATAGGQAEAQGGPPEYAGDEAQGGGAMDSVGSAEPSSSISSSGSGLQARNDLPAVRALNVKCEKNHMTVNIVFDRPFYGLVFSKGHYNNQKCVHLPANSGQTSINFDIHLGKCGMSSSDASGQPTNGLQTQQQQAGQQQPNGLYIENTIIIQYDPQVQEIFDQARKLRCTWYDYYEKSVTFRPYNVDMLDAVTANFLGDNIQCWMQIQVGKGPWSSEVAGIVKIGQTMTMVLAIKDDENRFDMLVRNCVAHDGKHQPIQLVDEYGCVARPKIMGKFQKVRNFGPAATVVSYAHFQAFKFPDSMSVHFQCVIQVCRYECPEPVCSGGPAGGSIEPAAQPAPSSTDYAASGTELVSAKEPLPGNTFALAPSGSNHTQSGVSQLIGGLHSGSMAHQALKLDESQGRVQVKLDTSMMAALGGRAHQAPATGPLPPHLLHAATSSTSGEIQQQPARGTAYLSSSHYKPAAATSSYGGRHPGATVATQSRPATSPQLAYPPASYAQAQQPQLHYSAPYPQSRYGTAYATNRLGEQAPDGGPLDSDVPNSPLSMIATPRALRQALATTVASNHRYRRAADQLSAGAINDTRRGRGPRELPDSTAIKTQRTIQVVSPDDMAFSLIGDDLPAPITLGTSPRTRQHSPVVDHLSTVCFSASHLLLVALLTMAVLATSIVIVAFVILRHRSHRLGESRKLSPVLEQCDADSQQCSATNSAAAQRHQQQVAAKMLLHQQHQEIQQRNNYLARLYSQFVPAAHWPR